MKIKNLIELLKNIKCIDLLNNALSLVNARREPDSSGSTLAFDTRDKIRRIGQTNGFNLDFENNKLILKIEEYVFEITSFNNKKNKALSNNQTAPIQLSVFGNKDNKNILDNTVNNIIGLKTDKARRKFTDIFLVYKSINGLKYSVDLINEFANANPVIVDTNIEDTKPSFFQPKKFNENIIENN